MYTDPSEVALIYEYWGNGPILYDLKTPIIYSIATVRARHPDLHIYVIQYDGNVDWADFPTRFNFQIVNRHSFFEYEIPRKLTYRINDRSAPLLGRGLLDPAPTDGGPICDYLDLRVCSRYLDVQKLGEEIPQKVLMYFDADSLLLDNLFPLECPRIGFCSRVDDNAGMFYFTKDDEKASLYLELLHSLLLLATRSYTFRRRLMSRYPGYRVVTEECSAKYARQMHWRSIKSLVQTIPRTEHYIASDVERPGDEDLTKIKLFHYCSFGPSRGRCAVLIQESYEVVREMFTRQELDDAFGLIHFNRSMVNRIDLAENNSVLSQLVSMAK